MTEPRSLGGFGRLGESRAIDGKWQQSTVRDAIHYGGREHVLHWDDRESILGLGQRTTGIVDRPFGGLRESQCPRLVNFRQPGIRVRNSTTTRRHSCPLSNDLLPAVWCFCASPEYARLRSVEIDQKLNVTNATLVKVPFDLDHWKKIAADQYPNGLPEPYSDDPTQWIFHGDPCRSVVWNEGDQTHRPRPSSH